MSDAEMKPGDTILRMEGTEKDFGRSARWTTSISTSAPARYTLL